MDKQEIQEKVIEFIYAKFPLAKKKSLSVDESLLESGVVDSMGILEIVTFIETDFSIQLSDEEVLADTFQSIRTITDLIVTKKLHSDS